MARARSMLLLAGAIGASLLSATVLAGIGRPRDMPGPTRHARPPDRLAQNDDCVACHADIAAEWAPSLHRRSFTDPMFQEALARERRPRFCRSCHAPEADPRGSRGEGATDPAEDLGVGCVSCHLVGDEILAGPARGSSDDDEVPHRLRRDPAFASPDACANCHEFWFPSERRGGHELLMQRTVSEHARSPAREQGCADCHMPPAAGGRVHLDHGFAVASNPRMLRAAVRIEAARARDEHGVERVSVRLEPRAVGHAMPTGDLFRRLAVRVGDLEEVYLARHFGSQRLDSGAVIKTELADDRVGVGPGPREVVVELPGRLRDQPVPWAVVYQRVLDTPTGAQQLAEVWDETTLAEGEL